MSISMQFVLTFEYAA